MTRQQIFLIRKLLRFLHKHKINVVACDNNILEVCFNNEILNTLRINKLNSKTIEVLNERKSHIKYIFEHNKPRYRTLKT